MIFEKQTHIIEASQRLFFKYGIKRVTVEDICKEANVSKMTYYKYYKNKNAILKTTLQLIFTDAETKFRDLVASNQTTQSKFEAIIKMKIDALNQYSTQFIEEYMRMIPDQTKDIEIFSKLMYELLVRIIEEGKAKGEISKSVNISFILMMLDKFQQFAEDPSIKNFFGQDYIRMASEITRLFLFGIIGSPDYESKG